MSRHNLGTEEGIENCKKRLNAIAKRKGLVDVVEVRENRTTQQNKYLHKCFQIIADDIGDTLESVKHDCKIELGHYEETRLGHKKPKPTHNLSVKDFADFVEKLIFWANNFHGIRLMSSEEYLEGSK